MAMLSFLTAREIGIDNPGQIVRAESTRRAYALDTSRHRDVQNVHSAGINTLDVDPVEHKYLLSGSADGGIAIHDIHNTAGVPKITYPSICTVGRGNKHRHKFSVESVQWYPHDTGMFISSGMDKTLKVWDTNNLVTEDEFQFSGAVYSHSMSSIATHHHLVATATQSAKVRLIDLTSGSATHVLRGHSQAVLSVQWSAHAEFMLASAGMDSKVMLWDIRRAKGCLRVLDQHNGDSSAGANSMNTAHNGHVNGMTFTSNGLCLITFGTDNHMRLWDVSTGRNLLVNYGTISNESRKCIKLSASSNCSPELIFVPEDSDISMYDIYSGIKINTLRGHYNQVNCCLFLNHSQEMFSGANDRTILVWAPQTSTVTAYDEHMEEGKAPAKQGKFVQRVGTMDNWSDDEDDAS